MTAFRFKHVCIEAFATNFPDLEVTSAELEDRLAPVYQRLQIPFGTLERLSGIRARRLWEGRISPSQVSTVAAQRALGQLNFDASELGAIFNCSVSRDYFEPATACLVHRNLRLPESCIAMDITNACLGFSNGLITLASMIDSGAVKAGLLVSGENVSRILESSIKTIVATEGLTREMLLKNLPTFTLGCGAVAFVLCHESMSSSKHRLLGSVVRCASEFNDLCNGNGDYYVHQTDEITPMMHTESALLIASAAKLGNRTWKEASPVLGWTPEDIDHIFCHQVGRQVNEGFYKEMGLPIEKEFTIYREYGNLVSAALPAAFVLGTEERKPKSGDKILLTAFGSGLNSIFTGIQW